jgi:hypothetical protein
MLAAAAAVPPVRSRTSAQQQPGYCATTESSEGDCDEYGESGSWSLPKSNRTLARCVSHCHRCHRCRFVSFSEANNDCSWFNRCGSPTLQPHPHVSSTYVTVRVDGKRRRARAAATNLRLAPPASGWPSGASQPAINLIQTTLHEHHPALQQVSLASYRLERATLTELNGLRVPAKYDCNNLNGGKAWGGFWYFNDVASRWHLCHTHEADVKSGLRVTTPRLPIVDDEYVEHAAVYHSVLAARADRPYAVAELGARWGTWGARAVAFLRARRPAMPHELFMAETSPLHCKAIRLVMAPRAVLCYAMI